MQRDDESREGDRDPKSSPKRRNILVRFLDWYWGRRDGAEKGNPVSRTVIAVALVMIGVASGEVYQWGKRVALGPDEFLVQIKVEQEKSFDRLLESLNALNASVDGGNRQVFSQVREAVQEIKSLNEGLVSRLVLANAENARMAKVAGIPGGIDLILSRDSGMRLDSLSHVGVQTIRPNGANVVVSSKDGSTNPKFLRSGESIAYVGADGGNCRVTLLSVDPNNAVSIANRCVPGAPTL